MLFVKCPKCGTKKALEGTIETHINNRIRCSKKAGGCGERFYTKANIIKDEGQKGTNYNLIPEKVVRYANGIRFESEDIRYFYKRITGKVYRGNDMDCYNELLFHLHQYKPIFQAKWEQRKRGNR